MAPRPPRQAPRQLPEWTIVDFIYRGYWWKNHGMVHIQHHCPVLTPNPGILMLNMCLFLPLITSAVNGLDSSLINGWTFSVTIA